MRVCALEPPGHTLESTEYDLGEANGFVLEANGLMRVHAIEPAGSAIEPAGSAIKSGRGFRVASP